MMKIEEILDDIYEMPVDSRGTIQQIVSEVACPRGTKIIRAGSVESRVYFISRGIVRAYIDSEDREQTFWFGKEGSAVVSLRSYVDGDKGYETIELLEDSILFVIEAERLKELFDTDVHIANWGRKFAESELIKTEQRLISRLFTPAAERYRDLITAMPDLIQRVRLGHIASYLGITQVSLSRIRAQTKLLPEQRA